MTRKLSVFIRVLFMGLWNFEDPWLPALFDFR